MPAQQRLRSHDDEYLTPIKQLGEQDQIYPSRGIDASGLDALLYVERQLTAQKEVLCLLKADHRRRTLLPESTIGEAGIANFLELSRGGVMQIGSRHGV